MAEATGLTVKDASKHNLNMVAESSSPGTHTRCFSIGDGGDKGAVTMREGDRALVWIALDEVMDL